jgi:alkylated DNA repair dioxygenase AlkB
MQDKFPNIINKDGQAIYFGSIVNEEEKLFYFNNLLNNIEWKNEVVIMFGKEITTKRKVAFYSDDKIEYTYSKQTKYGLAWTDALFKLKQIIESYTGVNYNACLLNLYHDGNEGMGWHSDDEKKIIPNSSIASLSLGAERKFSFKHKISKETVSIMLEHGSLLEMRGTIQKNWWHAMPKSSKVTAPRINLTFRQLLLTK